MILLAALLACSESGLHGKEAAPFDSGLTFDTDTGLVDTVGPVEVCNGLDDDGDGLTDEGFPDTDGDGTADCVDGECAIAVAALPAEWDPACERPLTPARSPWDLEVAWEFSVTEGAGCFVDAVGDITGDGISDVVCTGVYGPTSVLDGADGALEAEFTGTALYASVALGDIDADGGMDVITFDAEGGDTHVAARTWDGVVLWTSEAGSDAHASVPSVEVVADGEGAAHVLIRSAVLDGRSGATLAEWDPGRDGEAVCDVGAADLDGDGVDEILSQGAAWTLAGQPLWALDSGATSRSFALLQADEDPEPEVFWNTDDAAALVDGDGTIMWEVPAAPTTYGRASDRPCAGDIDGDGTMEILFGDAGTFYAYSAAGELRWSRPIHDETSFVGCSVFDFDLDGAKEVLVSDEDSFYILDGRTGDALFEDPLDSSTLGEEPIVADLDGDGSVEIVVNPRGGQASDVAVRVYRNAHRDWPPGSTFWGSSTWSGAGKWPDGELRLDGPNPWDPELAMWRGQPSQLVGGRDLHIELADSCVASCEEDGLVRIGAVVTNLGPQMLRAGKVVIATDSTGNALGTLTLGELAVGAAESVEFDVRAGEVAEGATIAVEDGDCDPSDDVVTWVSPCGAP